MKQILYDMGPLTLVIWPLYRAGFDIPFGPGSQLKRVSCMCLGTRTDSFVASCHTVSTNTTGRPPWIIRMIISLSILVMLTCLHIISAGVHTSAWYSLALTVKSTVGQLVTLGLIKPCCISMLCGCSCVPHCPAHSSCSGLSLGTRWTGALSLVVNCTAICSWVAAPLSSTESGTAGICENISHILTIYSLFIHLPTQVES